MSSQTKSVIDLNSQGVYPCPACRWGQIQTLPLMEAMACNFCHQIFTPNLEKQQLQMPSRQPPLTWGWNGRNWTAAHSGGTEFGWGYWLAAIVFVLLPTGLIGLTAYIFPTTPDTPLAWLPAAWVWLVFFSHLAIIGWVVVGFYQFPLRTYFRLMWRHLLRH